MIGLPLHAGSEGELRHLVSAPTFCVPVQVGVWCASLEICYGVL